MCTPRGWLPEYLTIVATISASQEMASAIATARNTFTVCMGSNLFTPGPSAESAFLRTQLRPQVGSPRFQVALLRQAQGVPRGELVLLSRGGPVASQVE